MGWTIRDSTSGIGKKYLLRGFLVYTQNLIKNVPGVLSTEAKSVPESDSKTEKTLQLSTTNIHNQKVRGHMR
jgi:hypothetical protein